MQSGNQQAYDRGITIFSPDGRLYQVEYAREAVKRGTASVGVRTPDGVVLAVHRHVRSPLLEPASIEKLHEVDAHVGVASAGHVADARQLVDFARRSAQGERLRYGEPIDVGTLTKDVTDHIQEYTQTGGARPFGAALLVGGVDGGDGFRPASRENGARPTGTGRPRLFEIDPSGTPTEWKATAIGSNGERIRRSLEGGYHEDLSLEQGVDLALEAMAGADGDGNGETEGTLATSEVGVATVSTETEQFRTLSGGELRESLSRLDLLAE